ncbi:hypothetical protein BD410DRAFT_119647 [Rickenella mellea]|uniref:F-box domain-containing protein n=1 Tax=Rickenella mellea TaxID=50990 RepID=A0A4Y7Q9Q0_9AGAM|nr:hypothetical protein BD410DRAFT_119647 [Rickenella mellea]
MHDQSERKVKVIQTRLTNIVARSGLDRIPDEILACIFESGHAMEDQYFFSLTVSHVCRRFRDVALKTPYLWTRINGKIKRRLIRTFLARSAMLDLDISFPSTSESTRGIEKYFDIVKPHSRRWSHITLNYPPFCLHSRIHSLPSLPRLRYLQCHCTVISFQLPAMPSLLHYKGNIMTLPRSPSLVICELNFIIRVKPARLVSTLYELKNLRHLSLSFNESSAEPWVEDVQTYQTKLPLKSLFLSSTNMAPSNIIPVICAILPFHPISKLTVAVVGNRVNDLWMNNDDHSFPYPASDIAIETLPLKFNPDVQVEPFDILTRVLRGTGAHTISIDSSLAHFIPRDAGFKSARDAPWMSYASLCKLRLKNCDELYEWQVKMFTDKLVSSEEGKGLQSLEILSCKNISEGFLLNLEDVLGSKLTWAI